MKTFNSVRKRLSQRYFSVNFEKFLGKFFSRTPPSDHFSHDVFFFFFFQISAVCSLKSIYLVEQWQIRTRNSQACSILCSYGNQVETSLSSCGHTYTHLGILIVGEVEEKEDLKNLSIWGKFSFHVMVDREIFTYVKTEK